MELDEAHCALFVLKMEKRSGTRRVAHSTLDANIADLLAIFKGVKQRVRGELRDPSSRSFTEDQQFHISGVGSRQVWIKQANAACQSLLCRWAEPFSLLATRETGAEHPDSYLRIAWDWLLQNHPHDSICGCSIDQVHQDMRFRFDQRRQIAEELTANALRVLANAPKLNNPPRDARSGGQPAAPAPRRSPDQDHRHPPPDLRDVPVAHGRNPPGVRAGLPKPGIFLRHQGVKYYHKDDKKHLCACMGLAGSFLMPPCHLFPSLR